jgi:F420H(2)-dependent quinone reductase
VAKPPPPASSPFWKLFNAFGRLQVRLMRLTRGRVGGRLMGVPVLVLHHRGRRSGQERETPLYYLDDGADVVVVASKGGVDTHPAWFHNLMAMPETEVEFVGERRRVRPRLADAEERARLWPRLVELYSPYEEYQTFTSREIPVVVLEPAAGASPS